MHYLSAVANRSMARLEAFTSNTSWLEPLIVMPVELNQRPAAFAERDVTMFRVNCPSVTLE